MSIVPLCVHRCSKNEKGAPSTRKRLASYHIQWIPITEIKVACEEIITGVEVSNGVSPYACRDKLHISYIEKGKASV